MAYNPLNPNGQTTMANSQPVVIANNQTAVSVAGTVNVGNLPSVYGNISGSVVSFQGGAWTHSVVGTVFIGGSVATIGTAAANQSVSGTVGASVIGTVPVVQSGTVITSVSGVVNVAGSVVATQGTTPWVVTGSVQGSFTPSGNQSVSGTVGASIIGNVPVVVQSSVAVAIISGSIAASFTPPANQSVSGTVNIGTGGPVSVMGTMSVLGTVPVTQSTTPWITATQGSVAVAIISGSIAASFTPPANQSVSGTVGASIIGSVPVTIAGPVPPQSVSGTVGASIIGQLPGGTAVLGSVAALQGTNPWTVVSSLAGGIFPISGSVAAVITNPNVNVSGSIAAWLQSTNASVITVLQTSSLLAVPVGSIIAVFQNPSLVGTYAEDAASASGDKGFLVMGARNDTLASVTSADGDYSSHVVGPAGELISVNAPFTKWIQGNSSVMYGPSIVVLAGQGASIFSYITGVQIANPAATGALVTFTTGSNSVLGYTMAPASGGSNIVLPNAWKTPANGILYASIGGVASVYITVEGFIAKV